MFSISVAYYISKIKWLNIFIAPLIFYISFVCLRCSFSLHQFPRVPLPPFVYSIHSEGIREAEKWEAGYSRGRARTKHDNSAIFFWQRNCCRESTLWKWRKWYNFHIFRPSEMVLFVVESWLFDEKTYWRRNYDVSQRFNLVPRVLSLPPSLLRERCRQIF